MDDDEAGRRHRRPILSGRAPTVSERVSAIEAFEAARDRIAQEMRARMDTAPPMIVPGPRSGEPVWPPHLPDIRTGRVHPHLIDYHPHGVDDSGEPAATLRAGDPIATKLLEIAVAVKRHDFRGAAIAFDSLCGYARQCAPIEHQEYLRMLNKVSDMAEWRARRKGKAGER